MSDSVKHPNLLNETRERLLAGTAVEITWERDFDSDAVRWGANLESMFGYDCAEVANHVDWWRTRVHPDDLPQVEHTIAEAIRNGAPGWSNEYRFYRKDGSWAWVASRCAIERDVQGRPRRAIGALIDISKLKEMIVSGVERRAIRPDEWASLRALVDGQTTGAVVVNDDLTERVRSEEVLRQTERLLVEAEKLGQTGSWEQDLISGQVFNTDANRRLFFGDDRSKGTRLEDYVQAIHPDDRDLVWRRRREFLAGIGSGEMEYRVLWLDGSVHWIFGRATVVRDESGRLIRTYGTNADITERKRAEEELARRTQQLEALSRRLIEAQEAERRAVARELHDDFGQVLTALRLNLARQGHDAESIALVDGAIARMRELATDLRPPLLDELGLEASLRWYVEREAKRAGLVGRLSLEALRARPPAAVETTAFRVAQEALTNVIRHAQAHVVEVELRQVDGSLELVVRDDGRGFDVAAARRRATHGGSQGLLSMQERVALVAGKFDIDSAPGRGTTIRARLPVTTD